jgi:hypothetical protein
MAVDFWLKLIGIFLGVLTRTLFPWLRKLKEGKVTRFDRRYLVSAIGTFLIGFIITLLIFPQFSAESAGPGLEAAFKLFAIAFGFGFGWNSLVFEAGKWAGAFKDENEKAVDNPIHSPDPPNPPAKS